MTASPPPTGPPQPWAPSFPPPSAAPAPAPAPAPAALALLGLGVVLAVSLATDLGLAWLDSSGHRPADLVHYLVGSIHLVVLSAVVMVVGRPLTRGVLAAAIAAFAAVLYLAFAFVIQDTIEDAVSSGGLDTDTIDVMLMSRFIVIGFLALTAWGLARRRGGWWTIGLAVFVGLAFVRQALSDDYLRLLSSAIDLNARTDYVVWVAFQWPWTLLPVLLAGVACWAIDKATTRG